jgi:hypothetical protein
MTISRPQLADALLTASHIAERNLIAAFIADAATEPAPNPFPNTSVGAVRQVWRQRAAEFQSFDVQVAGLACLLATLSDMSVSEALVQDILRAGPHTANVFHQGTRWQIVGAVLYGKPGHALPDAPAMPLAHRGPRRRVRTAVGQLDLFM